MKYVSKQICI